MNRKVILMPKLIMIGLLIFLGSATSNSQTNNCESQQIKPLLTVLSKRVGAEDKAISKLFQVGDECIDDLISTLNGTDFQMSVAAQEVIRYLGNEKGMRALDAWNKNNKKSYPVWGPVPVPIMDFDYEMVEVNLLDDTQKYLDLLFSPYLIALAIDKESPRSKALFQKVLEKLGSVNNEPFTKRIVDHFKSNYSKKSFSIANGIENSVLEHAFFLNKEDKSFTTAKLLSFNGKKDKALIELYLSRGVLAEEWHHVVIRKVENDWEFFSITFIRQS